MIKMMMGVPNMSKGPAFRLRLAHNFGGVRGIDGRGLPALAVMHQKPVIIRQARKHFYQ